MPTVTIFGSSQAKEEDPDYNAGRALGKKLAEAGYTVCNGGYGGIMEATARGAKEAGGKTIGVTTEDFGGPLNRWIDREIKMKKWSERLFKLIGLGDAYVIFDGGTGTLVELFVVWEMSNKDFIKNPVVVFGKQLQNLVGQVRSFPQVIDNPRIFFKEAPDEVVKSLDERMGKRDVDTQRF